MARPDELITVSRLGLYMKRVVQNLGQLQNIRVSGELSNYKRYSSGHAYFSLKDQDAQVSCVMFNSFASTLRFQPEDGQSVVVDCSAEYYVKGGKFQLQVRQMELSGEGELYRQFLKLKAQLEKEGLFDESRKQQLPFLPRRVGVITSESGAVIRDMIHVLTRRNPHFELILTPALVQGDQAPASLTRALSLQVDVVKPDVIIIGRGGGSMEDLWAFNDEGLARALAACEVPVVSAVGHETDYTICDFVCDLRAPTPSAAAELVMPVASELVSRLDDGRSRLAAALRRGQEERRRHLKLLSASRALRDYHEIVRIRAERLRALTSRPVLSSPGQLTGQFAMTVDSLGERLAQALPRRLERSRERLSRLETALSALNPLSVLGRGYALVMDEDGRPLTDAGQTAPGAGLELLLASGRLDVTVETVFAETMKGGSHESRSGRPEQD